MPTGDAKVSPISIKSKPVRIPGENAENVEINKVRRIKRWFTLTREDEGSIDKTPKKTVFNLFDR